MVLTNDLYVLGSRDLVLPMFSFFVLFIFSPMTMDRMCHDTSLHFVYFGASWWLVCHHVPLGTDSTPSDTLYFSIYIFLQFQIAHMCNRVFILHRHSSTIMYNAYKKHSLQIQVFPCFCIQKTGSQNYITNAILIYH